MYFILIVLLFIEIFVKWILCVVLLSVIYVVLVCFIGFFLFIFKNWILIFCFFVSLMDCVMLVLFVVSLRILLIIVKLVLCFLCVFVKDL